jgi:hypothetical protein
MAQRWWKPSALPREAALRSMASVDHGWLSLRSFRSKSVYCYAEKVKKWRFAAPLSALLCDNFRHCYPSGSGRLGLQFPIN